MSWSSRLEFGNVCVCATYVCISWDIRFRTPHIIHTSSSTHLPASKTVMKLSTNYLYILDHIIFIFTNRHECSLPSVKPRWATENWWLEDILNLMGSSQLLVRWHHCPPGRVHAKLRRGHRNGDDSLRMRGGLILHCSKMTHWWQREKKTSLVICRRKIAWRFHGIFQVGDILWR